MESLGSFVDFIRLIVHIISGRMSVWDIKEKKHQHE